MAVPRPYELWIEEMIRRAMDVDVEHLDDGSTSGMVDALILYADGSAASVEITTIAEQVALEAAAFPTSIEVQSHGWWELRYGNPRTSRKDVDRFGRALVRLLEALELTDAAELPESVLSGLPEGRWLVREGVSLRRYAGVARGGRLDVLPAAMGGGVDEYLVGLADWVEDVQETPAWQDNLSKLVRSGRDELHLALRIHSSGMPFALWSALWDPEEVRSRSPRNMEPLTHLWLFVGTGTTVTRWDSMSGWRILSYAPERRGPAASRDSFDLIALRLGL